MPDVIAFLGVKNSIPFAIKFLNVSKVTKHMNVNEVTVLVHNTNIYLHDCMLMIEAFGILPPLQLYTPSL